MVEAESQVNDGFNGIYRFGLILFVQSLAIGSTT